MWGMGGKSELVIVFFSLVELESSLSFEMEKVMHIIIIFRIRGRKRDEMETGLFRILLQKNQALKYR